MSLSYASVNNSPEWQQDLRQIEAVLRQTLGNTVSDSLFLDTFADLPYVASGDYTKGEKTWAWIKAGGASVVVFGGAEAGVNAGLSKLAKIALVRKAMTRLAGTKAAQILVSDVRVILDKLTASGLNPKPRFIARTDGAVLDTTRVRILGPRDTAQGKIDYLMGRVNSADSKGKGKLFVDELGFSHDATLEAALKQYLEQCFQSGAFKNDKFKVIGPMTGPNGATWNMLTGWQVTAERFIDFVTSFHGKVK